MPRNSLFAIVVLFQWTFLFYCKEGISFKLTHFSQPFPYALNPLLLPLVSKYEPTSFQFSRCSQMGFSLLLGRSNGFLKGYNDNVFNKNRAQNLCLDFSDHIQSGNIFYDALLNLISNSPNQSSVKIVLKTREKVKNAQEREADGVNTKIPISLYYNGASSLRITDEKIHTVDQSHMERQLISYNPQNVYSIFCNSNFLHDGVANFCDDKTESPATSRILLKSLRDTVYLMKQLFPCIPTNQLAETAINMIEIGFFHLKSQRFADALHMFNSAVRSLPLKAGFLEAYVQVHLAYTYLIMKKYSQALDHANHAREITPMYGLAWQRIGDAFRCTHQFWKALKAYEIAEYLDKETIPHVHPLKAKLTKLLRKSCNSLVEFKRNFLDIHFAVLKLPLGFALHGNSTAYGGCSIGYIIQDSNADKKEVLAGDQLIAINSIVLVGKSLSQCLQILEKEYSLAMNSKKNIEIHYYRGNLMDLYGLAAFKEVYQNLLEKTQR